MKHHILNKTRILLSSTALVVGVLCSTTSWGETITRETVTKTTDGTTVNKTVTTETPITTQTKTQWTSQESVTQTGNAHAMNFMDFDLSKDGVLSVHEMGEKFFSLYDTDGNGAIDNVEYEQRVVVSIAPVEKNTVVSYDFDGDGRADKTQYTYESFSEDTWLSRFDKNKDGLSAREFTGLHFNIADVNNDKMIDLKEWQGTYIPRIDAANKQGALLNR